MKKLASIFLALTLLAGLWVAPAAADDGNLVSNGTFDTYAGGRFTGWGAYVNSNTSYEAHEAIRGSRTDYGYCATLTQNGSYIQTSVENLTGGSVYEIAFDYQSLTDGRLEMMLSSRPANGSAVDYSYIYFPATGEEWGEFAFKYTLPAESNMMQIAFRANASAGEDGEAVQIDEVSLRLTDGDENLGFEKELAGWKVSGTAAVSEDAYSGAKSLKLSAGSTASKIVVTEGNTMDILGHVKATAGATATVKATPIHKSSAFAATAETISVTSAAWKKAEFKTLASSADPNATLRVLFPVLLELSVTGEGEAYFDNFTVDSYKNLITDPSFESTATNTNWRNRQVNGANLSTYRVENAYAPHGSYVIEIPADLDKKVDIKNLIEIPLEAGKFYEFSFWMCGVSGHSQAYVYLYDEDTTYGPNTEPNLSRVNFGQIKRTQTSTSDNIWRKQSVVFYAPRAGETLYNDVQKQDVTFAKDTSGCWIQVGKTASTAKNLIRYDMFCLREVDEYAGFYDDSPLQYINDRKVDTDGDGTAETSVDTQYGYAALGTKITTLSAGTYEFRFGKADMKADDDTATGLVALYEKKADGSEMLKKILAMSPSKYADATRSINASSTGADTGFQVAFTLEEADMDNPDAQYYVKGFGWTSTAGMVPLVSAAVLES